MVTNQSDISSHHSSATPAGSSVHHTTSCLKRNACSSKPVLVHVLPLGRRILSRLIDLFRHRQSGRFTWKASTHSHRRRVESSHFDAHLSSEFVYCNRLHSVYCSAPIHKGESHFGRWLVLLDVNTRLRSISLFCFCSVHMFTDWIMLNEHSLKHFKTLNPLLLHIQVFNRIAWAVCSVFAEQNVVPLEMFSVQMYLLLFGVPLVPVCLGLSSTMIYNDHTKLDPWTFPAVWCNGKQTVRGRASLPF